MHDTLAEPATISRNVGSDCVTLTVRVHDMNRDDIGEFKGVGFDLSTRNENTPKIVFFIEQFTNANETFEQSIFDSFDDILCRGAVVRVADQPGYGAWAYEIDNLEPVHGATVTANVTLLSQQKACLFPCPTA